MSRVLANASLLGLILLVVGLFAISDARPANAASYNYWMNVFSGASYSSGGVDKACVYQGYNANHDGVDLENLAGCSSTAGASVNMRTTGNTTDHSGGSYIFASATARPLSVWKSSSCTLHYIDVTVPKPYLGGQAWVERLMHSSRSNNINFYVGFAYSPSDWGAWLQGVYTVGSMYNEGSGCNPQYWTGYHLHQQRYSLGPGVSGFRNSFFNIPCCSVNPFTLWDHRREQFGWTRTI